jgi:hypothetical protein
MSAREIQSEPAGSLKEVTLAGGEWAMAHDGQRLITVCPRGWVRTPAANTLLVGPERDVRDTIAANGWKMPEYL